MPESAPDIDRGTPVVPLDEERAVVERMKRGDRAAFAVLYRWYGDAIYRTIVARVGQHEAAEDCLRDTFRQALEKIESFTYDRQSIYWWLRRIAVNKAMDVHRDRKRDRTLAERAEAEPAASPLPQASPRPDRGVEVEETSRDVEISLSRMNGRYAQALRLRLIEDRTREECAAALGVTVGNFDVILHRASKAFKEVWPP